MNQSSKQASEQASKKSSEPHRTNSFLSLNKCLSSLDLYIEKKRKSHVLPQTPQKRTPQTPSQDFPADDRFNLCIKRDNLCSQPGTRSFVHPSLGAAEGGKDKRTSDFIMKYDLSMHFATQLTRISRTNVRFGTKLGEAKRYRSSAGDKTSGGDQGHAHLCEEGCYAQKKIKREKGPSDKRKWQKKKKIIVRDTQKQTPGF